MNESCHTYDLVTLHMNTSCHTHQRFSFGWFYVTFG